MKCFKTIVLLIFFVTSDTQGQTTWDSLASTIRNDQLIIGCVNTQATLSSFSNDVHLLISAGKRITPHIVPLLDDEDKGIMAHYILTRIWKERKFKPVRNFAENSEMIAVEFHGLIFRINDGNEFIVSKEDLSKNKARWVEFLPRRYR